MAYGLRCWDPNGNITLDVTDRLSRVLTIFNIPVGVHSGSVSLPSASGEIWVHVANKERANASGVLAAFKSSVAVSISGSTLTWSRTVIGGYTIEYPIQVTVGVY